MKKLFVCLLAMLLLAGCGTVPKSTSTVYAMDTVMTLTAYGPNREDCAGFSGFTEDCAPPVSPPVVPVLFSFCAGV